MKNSVVAVKQTKSAPVGVITPELLKDLSIRFGAALNEIVKPMGMVVAMDGSRYGKSHANMKMRLLVTAAGEKAATKPFERECRELGINPDLIGKKFTSARFGECTFVGVNLNRPKMVLDVLTADGRSVRGPIGMIQTILANEVKAAKKVSTKKAAVVEDDDLNLDDDDAPAATGKRTKRTAKAVNNMTDAEMIAALSDGDDETPKVRSRRSAKKPAAKKAVSAKGKAFAAKMKAAREAAQAKRSGKKVAAKPARSARNEKTAAPKLTRAERALKAERAIKRLERKAAKRAAERKAERSAKRTTTKKPAAKVARKTTRSAKPAARKGTKRRSRMA